MKSFCTYTGAIKNLADILDKRRIDLSIKHVIIVPEKYTLLTEQAIFDNSNGAFDIDVMSFSRLYQKLLGEFCLSKEGAIVVLKKILSKNKLKVYEKTKAYNGYADRLYKEISGLIMNGITPLKLSRSIGNLKGALGLKLEDIWLVYDEFLKQTDKLIVDRFGKLLALKNKLKTSNYFDKTHTYVLNFDYTTALEEEIIKIIKKNSLSFYRPPVLIGDTVATDTNIYNTANGILAIKSAAKKIREANFEGINFRDIAIACEESSHDGIKRIFSEFGIPFYIDKKPKLKDQAIAKLVLILLDLKLPSRTGFLALAKNERAGIEPDEICHFENYCDRHLIDYKGFFSEFEDERAEAVRKKLVFIRDSFWDKALENMLDDILDDSAVAIRIKELFDLSLMTGEGADFVLESFKENLLSSVFSSIAKTSDAVIVSDAAAFRGAQFIKGFMLDFNENITLEKADGILSHAEAAELDKAGLKLGNLAKQKQESKIKDIVSFMNSLESLEIYYTKTDEIRPSPLLHSLNFINAKHKKEGHPYDEKHIGNRVSALEYLLLNINSDIKPPFISEIYHVLKNEADSLLFAQTEQTAPCKDFFDALFFPSKTTSASQLEEFCRCPFRHFIKYGLRIKEDRGGEIDALDAGNLVHSIAEKFVQASFCEATLKKALKAPFGYKFSLTENAAKKERLTSIIEKLALRFKGHIEAGDTQLLGTELSLPNFEIDGLKLVGKVDYADYIIEGEKKFIRIVDYKSGKAKFNRTDTIKGEKLQLALYMLSFLKNGYEFGAMLYYPFRAKWNEKDAGFCGVTIKDDKVIDRFGGEWIMNKNGKGAMSKEDADRLLNDAKITAGDFILRIKEGQRAAIKSGVCSYCKYECERGTD